MPGGERGSYGMWRWAGGEWTQVEPKTIAGNPLQNSTMAKVSRSRDFLRVAGTRAQLREAEAYFKALLNAAVDAIIVIDHQGRVEAFNNAAVQMFGYATQEVIGKNVTTLMSEPHSSAHDGYIQNYLKTRQAKIIGTGREVSARRKDGTEFPIELAVREVRRGDAPRFIGIVKDISERQRLHEEANKMQAELEHATRLNVLGEMATGIAHEINQPLTAITTYAQACQRMLANEAVDSAELAKALESISGQAHRAGEVIRRLRAFAKKRVTQRQQMQANELVDSAIRLAEPDIRTRKFTMRAHLTPGLPTIIVDPVQIQQVMLNLIRNAMDAAEESRSEDKVVTVTTELNEDRDVQVSFTDGGAGLSVEAEEHLFDPFFTTKQAGMGMGLSISRSIITAHGGIIDFHANPGGGTTFYFTLPRAASQ